MALSRCIDEHAWPKGKSKKYDGFVKPVGYPDTALICGIPTCNKPGVIWLTTEEIPVYESGERIFSGPNNFAKMKADNNGVTYRKND